ncbi:MAG: glycosyltransferase family 9 protein, partial [Calditrichaeota bacterium]|nr:glycosyltransferase family 9 protein [Calditrichota bacterium]
MKRKESAKVSAAFSLPNPIVVALHFRRIGDSLMATPALKQIHLIRPGARILVLVESGAKRVFEGNPAVSDILVAGPLSRGFEFFRVSRFLRKQKPHVVLDFLSDPRSALLSKMSGAPVRIGIGYRGRGWAFTHLVPCQDPSRPIYSAKHKAQLAEPFGELDDASCALEFFLRPEDEEAAANLWTQRAWSKETRVVALGVHSRREYKRWPVERFAQAAQRLIHECDVAVALLAGPGEEAV